MLVQQETTDLQKFGSALAAEIDKIGDSYAKFAKETGGISKGDIREFIAGTKVPDKITVKKLLHCFPILMQYEHILRHAQDRESSTRHVRPRHAPRHEPTRLAPPPRQERRVNTGGPVLGSIRPVIATPQPRPVLEIVRQHEPPAPPLAAPLAPMLVKALRKTHAEMLAELARTATRKLGALETEEFDFAIKNDGVNLVVKLRVPEGDPDDDGDPGMVDSGCYVSVGPRSGNRIGVFCQARTGGNVLTTLPRIDGTLELMRLAKEMHAAVNGRQFDG